MDRNCRSRDIPKRPEGFVLVHILDDDAAEAVHRCTASQGRVAPHDTQLIQKILRKPLLCSNRERLRVMVVNLHFPHLRAHHRAGRNQDFPQSCAKIRGSQKPADHFVQSGHAF